MTNVDEIKAYMEWRQEREGREVDVSPETYALHMAIFDLRSAVRDVITELDPKDVWQAHLAVGLDQCLTAVDDAFDLTGGL